MFYERKACVKIAATFTKSFYFTLFVFFLLKKKNKKNPTYGGFTTKILYQSIKSSEEITRWVKSFFFLIKIART